ncbi:unnamed protein product [Prorocentrum cordatum]|uniref:Uncharacterized protein n=1 Tax=Prorocentrum cordatum TaxID=2364126 RepID=A0ABN9UDG0_9DINO|nr:unnamed protein product [Polarella glacialis]
MVEPGRPGPLRGRHPQRAGLWVRHAVAPHPAVDALRDLPLALLPVAALDPDDAAGDDAEQRSPGAPKGSDLVAGPTVEPAAALALTRHEGQTSASEKKV